MTKQKNPSWQTSRKRPADPFTRRTTAEYQQEQLERTLEHTVQKNIVAYLLGQGLLHSITNAERTYNTNQQLVRRINPGWPDLTACETGALNPAFAGKMFGIECKRAMGGTLSYEQAVTLESIYRSHGLVCVARSVEDVMHVRQYGNRQVDLEEIAEAIRKGPPKDKFKITTRRRGAPLFRSKKL
jgi:hypothetical protein